MRGHINVRFFNGVENKCDIGVRVMGQIRLLRQEPIPTLSLKHISPAALSIALSALEHFFQLQWPDVKITAVHFNADSVELERFVQLKAQPDEMGLAQLLSCSVLSTMLAQCGADVNENEYNEYTVATEEELAKCLSEKYAKNIQDNSTEIRRIFLSEGSDKPHPLLERAQGLQRPMNFQENLEQWRANFTESLELLDSISTADFSPAHMGLWSELKLRAETALKTSDNEIDANKQLYEKLLKKNKNNPSALLNLHFIWMRYLQDKRGTTPRKMCDTVKQQIKKNFPESVFSDEQKTCFEYLSGRADYSSGEYIGALVSLDHAFSNCDVNDHETRSDILNTAASSFTDNFFFDQADALHSRALETRRQLHLSEKADETLSAMGITAFKRRDFKGALKLFLESFEGSRLKEQNRICNYLAKAALFCGDYKSAEKYLDQALDALGAKKDAVKSSFTYAIKMALLVTVKDYDGACDLFKKTFLLPEYRKDPFTAAWGYYYEAEACFQLGRIKDALQYQARAVRCFHEDRFILEEGLAALKPYLWDLEGNEPLFSEYCGLFSDINVIDDLDNYLEAHNNLPELYFSEILKSSAAKDLPKANLAELIDLIKGAGFSKDPRKVQKAFDFVCLL